MMSEAARLVYFRIKGLQFGLGLDKNKIHLFLSGATRGSD